MDLDPIDQTILNELQTDGRMSNNELADRIGLSPSATFRRVRRLEESGVITGFTAVVDPATISRGTTVFVEISLLSQDEDRLDAFEAAVGDSPNVMSCHLMAGSSDYLVRVACDDVADYERIHRTHLALLPGVTNLRSSFALRTVRDRIAHDLT